VHVFNSCAVNKLIAVDRDSRHSGGRQVTVDEDGAEQRLQPGLERDATVHGHVSAVSARVLPRLRQRLIRRRRRRRRVCAANALPSDRLPHDRASR